MPPGTKDYGYLKNFEKTTYKGQEVWRSKKDPDLLVVRAPPQKGQENFLYGWPAEEPTTIERGLAWGTEGVKSLLWGKQAAYLGITGGGGLPDEEPAEEEPTLTAELLSLDPSDPRTMGRLLLDNNLSTLSAQLAENPEMMNEEGVFEQWMNLALVEQGMATDPQMAAAATQALGQGYLEAFAAGDFDTPDKAEAAAQMYAQQLQALTGFEEAVAEEAGPTPEDELTALYEQQVKDEAEFQQRGFYRQGIMDLVSLAPAEARLGMMAGMLENPDIASLFFPKESAQAEGGLPPESKFVIE